MKKPRGSVLSIRGFLCHAPRDKFALGGGLGGRARTINSTARSGFQKGKRGRRDRGHRYTIHPNSRAFFTAA